MRGFAFIGATIFLSVLTLACLYRAYAGPTPTDRVISINVITTKITTIIALLATITLDDSFVDVSLVYAMTGFIMTICVAKYVEKGKLF
ncbi:monovalent cation/H+ antiporter complex subunit F [Serpentinicella alkaliphila]|uniref:Multisubunit sodium/proton antiporter MrpF subunit n=1 Tax=Serpentinicella alkaliphila TaxID=1734049 RepID=A0A4R2TS10_9FIRM|nr:monovalent cation/H+ antiporter complex subunit F [Serpentinicella alkaliphila]QUH25649.1 cation:proton antiporter [Serpentinicella alkaliphila]TCQ06640.1 multisubunit sodium/proton antiporter MrpF subunit [Serpentinicella alkaliphila]